jgi:hypothetical protein
VARPRSPPSPNSGPWGTSTAVTGQGFAPHEQVAIYRQTRVFLASETDGNTNLVGAPHSLMGPGPRSGITTMTKTRHPAGRKAATIFMVTP